MTALALHLQGPYDLALSLRAASNAIGGAVQPPHAVFRSAIRVAGAPTLLEVRQPEEEPEKLEVSAVPEGDAQAVADLAARMLFVGLDLEPFYELVGEHAVLGPVTRHLRGLKPLRPATLFEMLVIVVLEQQISMAAAHRIRSRLIERYGTPVEDLVVFPTPSSLAQASVEELRACGLSGRKAEYMRAMASAVDSGTIDLERLETLPDDEVHAAITALRGFGPWSADYLLVRGLGRPDRVPADDLGVRTVVGRFLGGGVRLGADEVRRALAAFAPYRGLAAFYLLVEARF